MKLFNLDLLAKFTGEDAVAEDLGDHLEGKYTIVEKRSLYISPGAVTGFLVINDKVKVVHTDGGQISLPGNVTLKEFEAELIRTQEAVVANADDMTKRVLKAAMEEVEKASLDEPEFHPVPFKLTDKIGGGESN